MAKKHSKASITFLNARLTSTISVSLVLFLLGLIILLGLLAGGLSHYVKENMSFSIVLAENVPETQILSLQNKLGNYPFVKSITYISKEQAAKELEEELGEHPETFLGYNPLQASLEVKLKSAYANNDSIMVIEKTIKQQANVQDLSYRHDLLQLVNDNIKKTGAIVLFIAAILMIISFALISNTIRLSIYSKRFIINTMKLVGATNGFIRGPFIKSNIASGIVAAILASCMLSGVLYYLSFEIKSLLDLLTIPTLLLVFAAVLILGVVLSALASFIAVNRYLRMETDKLYYI